MLESNYTIFENFEITRNKMMVNHTNLIFYNDAFAKTEFISKIIDSSDIPILYLDFDLLFSGYLRNDSSVESSNIQIIKPDKKNLKNIIPNILAKVSLQKTILILDSLNGLSSFIEDENPGRFVNSLIMLFCANLKFSQSIFFITCQGQKKEDNWVLPTGRHILQSENINRFEIIENNSKMKINQV